MLNIMRKIKRSEEGTAAIEMAMVFPIFMLFILGIIEFSRAYWTLHTMDLSIEEAARYAIVNTTAYDSAIVAKAKDNLYGFDSSQFTITSQSQNINGITYKVITATYPFNFIIPNLLPFNSITLTRTVSAPII
jgi:Flp pilus assembly protein TadG